jgi:hypothetical protein
MPDAPAQIATATGSCPAQNATEPEIGRISSIRCSVALVGNVVSLAEVGFNMKLEIVQRAADRVWRALYFLRGWIAAPSVPRPTSETGRINDPRRAELRNIPPAGMGGSM